MDYFQKQPGSELIATVGGKKIKAREYYLEVDRVRSMLRRQFGDQYEQFEKMINIKQKVLDEMIDKSLLEVFFKSLNFVVSTTQVETFTRGLPVFADGVDRQKFSAFLQSQGMTEGSYESMVTDQLKENQLSQVLGSLALYGKAEREKRYLLKESQIGFYSAKISSPLVGIEISNEKIEEYYQANKSRYQTSKQILPLVVRFSPDRYQTTVKVDEQELVDLYEANRKQYEIPRQVRYSTLSYLTSKSALTELIEGENSNQDADDNIKLLAEDLRTQIVTSPEQFESLGKQKGATFKSEPELLSMDKINVETQNILQGLKVNEISPVTKLGEEYVLLKVVEDVPSSVKPFEEVKEQLRVEIVNKLTPEYAKVGGENFLRSVEDQGYQTREDFIKKLASEKGLSLEESGTPLGIISDVALEDLSEVMSLAKGSSVLVSDKAKTGYVYVYIRDVFEPKEKPLEQVKTDIVAELKRVEALNISKEKATKFLASLPDVEVGNALVRGRAVSKLLTEKGLKVEEVPLAKREAIALTMIEDPRQKADIIAAIESNGYYSQPYVNMSGEVYILGMSKVEKPKDGIVPSELQAFMSREQQAVSASGLNQLINYLRAEIKPEVSLQAGL